MRKGKLCLLVGALVLAMAVPASASERNQVRIVTNTTKQGNVICEEYVTVDQAELDAGTFSLDSASASKTVKVENPNKTDTKAPVLKSISINKTRFATNRDGKNKLEVKMKISEAQSGYNYGSISFISDSGKAVNSYLGNGSYYYDPKKSTLRTDYSFWAGSEGNYKFFSLSLCDMNGNRIEYRASDKNCPEQLKKLSFTVVAGKTTAKPSVTSASFSKSTIKFKDSDPTSAYKNTTFTIKTKCTGSKVVAADVSIQCKKSETSTYGVTFLRRDADSNGTIKFSTSFANNDWDAGTWYINQVRLYCANGDIIILSEADKTLSSSISKKTIKVIISGATESEDKNFPKITSAKFTTTKLKLAKNKDGVVNLEVGVSEKGTGVSYVSVDFYSSKLGKNITQYYSPTKLTKSGKIVVPITINRFSATGIFELSSITIADKADNKMTYVANKTYYSDYSGQKYSNFLSDMKGMAISIKNTSK